MNSRGTILNATVHEKRPILALGTFVICLEIGLGVGLIGLRQHNQHLTWLSACLFAAGSLFSFVCMVYPFRWGDFWYSYILGRLGRIGWAIRFGIGSHAEGAISLALFSEIWTAYYLVIVGGESYLLNNLSTIMFSLFASSWIFYSTHLLFQKLRDLENVGGIISVHGKGNAEFRPRVRKIVNWFNKKSAIFMALGGIVVVAISTYWIDWRQDDVIGKLLFYVTVPWTGGPGFGMAYPFATIPYVMGKVSLAFVFGFLALVGGLVLTTVIMFLLLTSCEVKPKIRIFDIDCLRPINELLNSFWLLTGAGLLLVPVTTALSSSFAEVGQNAAARWENYISMTYIVFFVGMFFFSLIKFYSFVSTAKRPVEKQIRKEFEKALKPPVNRDMLVAVRAKARLLESFKNRPTITTIAQVAEIVLIILFNYILSLLGMKPTK